jgi:hypothetical protein
MVTEYDSINDELLGNAPMLWVMAIAVSQYNGCHGIDLSRYPDLIDVLSYWIDHSIQAKWFWWNAINCAENRAPIND